MLLPKAGLFCVGWKKWQKQIMLTFFALALAIFGVFSMAKNQTAFAIPDDTVVSETIDAPVVDETPSNEPETITEEESETTTAEGTTSTESSSISTSTSTSTTSTTCYDQAGAIGWIICPTGNTLANLVSNLYTFMSDNLLRVAPIATDDTSVIYIIWEYARNITNIIFIIFIIIIVISQVTGFGINNYGIKRTLPRIIIAAILVNLSYIICALAIDLSNVIGYQLIGFFDGIKTSAIASGAIPTSVASANPGGILLSLLGIGAAGAAGVVGFTMATGGSFWFLLPIVLAAGIAILIAVITMAARQALIYLLTMISPLAFVAYLLPNTEKLFVKWKDLLLKMVIFFPMMSFLFGGASLAGFAIIASAQNTFGTILGVAVQVLPLIFTPGLLKMSGTMLGNIGNAITKATSGAQNKLSNWSREQTAIARAKHNANNRMLSSRLNNFMANRNALRASDKTNAETINKNRASTYALNKTASYKADTAWNRMRGTAGDPSTRLTNYTNAKNMEKDAQLAQIILDNNRGELKDYAKTRLKFKTVDGKENSKPLLDKDGRAIIESGSKESIAAFRAAEESTRLSKEQNYEEYRAEHGKVRKTKALADDIKDKIDARYTNEEEFNRTIGRITFADSDKEQSINSVLASAIGTKDSDNARLFKDSLTRLSYTATTTEELQDTLKRSLKEDDKFTARAALKLLASKGSFNAKSGIKSFLESSKTGELSKEMNNAIADLINNDGDVGKAVRSVNALAFDWATENSSSNVESTVAFSDEYYSKSGFKYDKGVEPNREAWMKFVWSQYVTSPADRMKQASDQIRDAFVGDIITPGMALDVLKSARNHPEIRDDTKLHLFAYQAGLIDPSTNQPVIGVTSIEELKNLSKEQELAYNNKVLDIFNRYTSNQFRTKD